MIDRNEVKNHFNRIAAEYDGYKEQNHRYYEDLKSLIQKVITGIPVNRALEIGCGTGNLLATIPSQLSLGGDISMNMTRLGLSKWETFHNMHFIVMAAEEIPLKPVFDFILAVDLMEHVPDPAVVLKEIRSISKPGTRVLVTAANPLWTPVLHYAERKKLKMPEGPHQWPSLAKLRTAGVKAGFTIHECGYRYFCPFDAGIAGKWINSALMHIPVFRRLGLIQYLVFKV